jgi:putative mycofactocin binding protein MftB
MNLDAYYSVAPGVAIRPERFGGLAYRYDNRRLFFLHSHELVDFVRQLDGAAPLADVLDDFLTARALPVSARETFIKAMTQLEKLGIIDRPLQASTATQQCLPQPPTDFRRIPI